MRKRWMQSLLALFLCTITLTVFLLSVEESASALSSYGSRGTEVRAIQEKLKERGLYNGSIDGVYGSQTQKAVKAFQKQQGLTQDGIAGPATLKRLGITIGKMPAATEANVYLLARIISAEARGEPYSGQVAVGAVVLNRVEHPSFPDTLSGVIYQDGAFTAIVDGQFDQPIADYDHVAVMLSPQSMSVERFFDRNDPEKQFILRVIESCEDPEAVMENYRRGLALINSQKVYDRYANSGFFTVVRQNDGSDTREEVCDIIARHFGLI